ncbi:unnamed protein product (macronuclear) [Paramecium tetraurelia]|uniref:Uncharacterized protein n=1 Tax=Paramecium tetraurelia TaxID=5888 RepID=A0CYX3_PARTE|nr:uncharacterized protein GSPATT00011591001 [Paramecium tetraurelia]CAK75990.1 unnamed protein product [Paramecium tetraurelia]|eukprot:XP_001443387.1 hypothetical protein (macronuclear) [Paramecium tetraurelia strain d4-2]
MLDIQAKTNKEIWQAKKLLYESDGNTKKSLILNLVALGLLLILLFYSIIGSDDKWTCEIESANNRGHYICVEMRRTMNCKTISGPIRSEIFLKVKQDLQASAIIECPWEIAVSEVRLCFILLSISSVLIGIYALRKSNKKYGELSFQIGIAFSVLLLISAYFDYISIKASQINNYNLCNLQEEFSIEEKMKGQMECSFSFYNFTVFLELACSIALIINSIFINQWRYNQITELNDQL